jgi:hypothetical protein
MNELRTGLVALLGDFFRFCRITGAARDRA